MAKERGRTQPCTAAEARTRRDQAKRFLEIAELAAHENDPDVSYGSVAASLAVLAGIAASDAACCFALKERSRSDNHRDAADLLASLPRGSLPAKSLRELLDLKDTAHYGLIDVADAQLKKALRRASDVVDFADSVLAR